MSQETHDKMKKDLEGMFNILAEQKEYGRKATKYWADNPGGCAEKITSFTSIVEAYAKLELVDEQRTANKIAQDTNEKNVGRINWKQ